MELNFRQKKGRYFASLVFNDFSWEYSTSSNSMSFDEFKVLAKENEL
jgi:hypothetical protein